MKYENLTNLTKEEKQIYLAKYLNRYIDEIVSKFTNNKNYLDKVINDNTIMSMIITVIDNENNRLESLIKNVTAPYDIEHFHYNSNNEYNHVLYNLIIK